MHELAIAQDILDIVREHVPERRAVALRSVKLRVGGLSGVVPESLEFCFSAIVAETPWQGAHLDIERVPTVLDCNACGERFQTADMIFECARCGGSSVRIVSGNDLHIVSFELDEEQLEVS